MPSRLVAFFVRDPKLKPGNTLAKSLEVFSSSMLAAPSPAKSQPARVNATHGAGVFALPPLPAVSWLNVVSPPTPTGSVQYLNAEVKSEPPTLPLVGALGSNTW